MSLGFELELDKVLARKFYRRWFLCYCGPATISRLGPGEFDKEVIFVSTAGYVQGVVEHGFLPGGGILELVTTPDLADVVDVTRGHTKAALDNLQDLLGYFYLGKDEWRPDLVQDLPVSWQHSQVSVESTGGEISAGTQVNFSADLALLGATAKGGQDPVCLQKSLGLPDGKQETAHVMTGVLFGALVGAIGGVREISDEAAGFVWLTYHVLATETVKGSAQGGGKLKYAYLPRASVRSVASLLRQNTKSELIQIWPRVFEVALDKLGKDDKFTLDFARSRLDFGLRMDASVSTNQDRLHGHYKKNCAALYLDAVGDALGVDDAQRRIAAALAAIRWTKALDALWNITQVCDTKAVPPKKKSNNVVSVVLEARNVGTLKGSPREVRTALEGLGAAAATYEGARSVQQVENDSRSVSIRLDLDHDEKEFVPSFDRKSPRKEKEQDREPLIPKSSGKPSSSQDVELSIVDL